MNVVTVTTDTAWPLGLVLVMAVGTVGASAAWRRITRETREADRVRLREFLDEAIKPKRGRP